MRGRRFDGWLNAAGGQEKSRFSFAEPAFFGSSKIAGEGLSSTHIGPSISRHANGSFQEYNGQMCLRVSHPLAIPSLSFYSEALFPFDLLSYGAQLCAPKRRLNAGFVSTKPEFPANLPFQGMIMVTMLTNPSLLHPSDTLRFTHARASIDRLLSLDDFWTVHLSKQDHHTPADRQALHDVGSEMTSLLAQVQDDMAFFENWANSNQNQLDEAFNEFVKSNATDKATLAKFEEVVRKQGGFKAFVMAGVSEVRKRGPSEVSEINTKLTQIAKGGVPPGDLTIRCALLAAGMGVAAGAGIWPAAAGLFGVSVAQGCWG
jgi:hypothetical protein